MSRYFFIVWIGASITAPSLGAPQQDEEVPETPADEQASETRQKLPEPLSEISGNLDDLEKTGYFKIIDGQYGRTKQLSEKAIIWTIEVVKPLTCGHAMILFQRLGDVRFYRVRDDGSRQQLLSTQLYYSSWIEEGAVNHEILGRDERFQVWLLMRERQTLVLEHEGASIVVFAEPKRRRANRKNLWRETHRYRLPESHSRIPHRAVGAH